MFLLIMLIILIILTITFFVIADSAYEDTPWWVATIISFIFGLIIFIYGCIHGFIYYGKTEGTHQGVITAVDLEGTYFRRYEVYLKSSGYTNQSDETKYLIYEYEDELAEQLKDAIGKTVKIHYGHDGGYIPWNSCGTVHIKSIEIVDENDTKDKEDK